MIKPIQILIADDHELVRKGLRAMMDTKPDIAVIGEAADGNEAVLQARALQPDVILLDLMMPHKDGLVVICEIKQENPEARILMLTSFANDDKVFAAIKSGALGCLLKDSSPQELLQVIRTVHRGEAFLSPTIALKLMRELNRPSDLPLAKEPLTPRELQVLKLVAHGLSDQEITAELTISQRTMGTHVSAILDKLHLANRTQSTLYALLEGPVSLRGDKQIGNSTNPPHTSLKIRLFSDAQRVERCML